MYYEPSKRIRDRPGRQCRGSGNDSALFDAPTPSNEILGKLTSEFFATGCLGWLTSKE
jgi:hypothetical protein